MLAFQIPAALNGSQLTAELEAAGYQDVMVFISGDDLHVAGRTESGSDITEQSRSSIQGVIDAHVPNPDYGRDTTELTARDQLRNTLQTLANATKDKPTWDGLSAEQRQDATRSAIRSFVLVCRFLAKRFLER